MDRPTEANLLNPLTSLEWEECSKMPLAMSNAQAVVVGDKVYMGGGDMYLHKCPGSPSTLYVYDFRDNSWDFLDTPIVDSALNIYNSQLVLVGGRDSLTYNSTNQLWVLDSEQQCWAQPLPPMPTSCYGTSAVSFGHHLLVAGGLNDKLEPLSMVQMYDGNYWRRAQDLPKAGYFMKSSLLNETWYLIGGGNKQGREVISTSLYSLIASTEPEWNRRTKVWRKLPNIPSEWSTAVTIRKQLAVIGGYPYSSAIHIYSHYTKSWVYVEDLPVACHSTCTVVLPTEELLVVGGETERRTLPFAFKAKIKVSSFPDSHFTVSAIERLNAIAGISIWNHLASSFLRMAAALQLDPCTISDLKTENNPIEGSRATFIAWLAGKSTLPPTWKILLEKLYAIQMGELVQEIEHFFNQTHDALPSASLISESEKGLEVDVSMIERKEQQTKPDCSDVAVQSTPDCKEVAVQVHTAAKTTGSVRGVEILAEKEFTVLDKGGFFEWKEFGMRLHVPKGSISTFMGEYRINIQVSLHGQFELPKGLDLLSPVFWISAPYKFMMPVTLEIQHCTLRENITVLSDLSFVSAKCSQRDLPYSFRQVDGGVFTPHSSYGSIDLNHFSGIAVTGRIRTPRSYCAHLYHTMKQVYDWRFYLVITQDLNAQITAVKYHYDHFAKWDTSLKIVFHKSEITLDIPEDGELTQEGWKITPMSYPSIARRDVDEFREGQWIPQCELMMEWKKKDDTPVRLQYKIKLNGARAPKNYFQLVLDPTEGVVSDRQRHVPSPEMKDLMDAFYHTVAEKWEHIGIYLHLPLATLKTISEEYQRDPHKCLVEMLGVWLKRVHPPPTWSAIIDAVVFLGEEQLGRKLREEYQL